MDIGGVPHQILGEVENILNQTKPIRWWLLQNHVQLQHKGQLLRKRLFVTTNHQREHIQDRLQQIVAILKR